MIGLSFLVIISTTCNPRIGSESDPATGVPVAPSGAVLPFAAPIVKVLLLVFGAAILWRIALPLWLEVCCLI